MRDVVMRFLREFGNWRTAHDTGVWRYQENTATGRRRILRASCDGYQPIDASWTEGQGRAAGNARGPDKDSRRNG